MDTNAHHSRVEYTQTTGSMDVGTFPLPSSDAHSPRRRVPPRRPYSHAYPHRRRVPRRRTCTRTPYLHPDAVPSPRRPYTHRATCTLTQATCTLTQAKCTLAQATHSYPDAMYQPNGSLPTVPYKSRIILGIVICLLNSAMTLISSTLLSRLLFEVSIGAGNVSIINIFGGIVLGIAAVDGGS
jgi:hypothetical protein